MEKETILTPQQCLDYGFCDEIAETTIDENKLLQSERKILNQMKRDMLSQKSMREEMLAFIKLANISQLIHIQSTRISWLFRIPLFVQKKSCGR